MKETTKNYIKAFQERIRPLIDAAGGSSAFSEKYFGTKGRKQLVGDWYNGHKGPSLDMLITLSQKLGVSTDYLLGLTSINNLSGDEIVKQASEYTGLNSESIDVLHEWTDQYSLGNGWVGMLSDLITNEWLAYRENDPDGCHIISKLYTYLIPENDDFYLVPIHHPSDKKKRKPIRVISGEWLVMNNNDSYPFTPEEHVFYLKEEVMKQIEKYKSHVKKAYGSACKTEDEEELPYDPAAKLFDE